MSVGERVCFHMANLQTQQGKALCYRLEDKQGLIRESDVFFALVGDAEITL